MSKAAGRPLSNYDWLDIRSQVPGYLQLRPLLPLPDGMREKIMEGLGALCSQLSAHRFEKLALYLKTTVAGTPLESASHQYLHGRRGIRSTVQSVAHSTRRANIWSLIFRPLYPMRQSLQFLPMRSLRQSPTILNIQTGLATERRWDVGTIMSQSTQRLRIVAFASLITLPAKHYDR